MPSNQFVDASLRFFPLPSVLSWPITATIFPLLSLLHPSFLLVILIYRSLFHRSFSVFVFSLASLSCSPSSFLLLQQ